MPYLPSIPTEQTEFPEAWAKDVRTQIGLIEGQYKRFFPRRAYYAIKKNPTAQDAQLDPVGAPGTTAFDPMWREAVDPNMSVWTQPHGSPDFKAAGVEVYAPPVWMNFRLQRNARKDELQKYGFDRVWDLLIHIPCSILDASQVTVQVGDYFNWAFNGKDDQYAVMQFSPSGWWKNSNIFLYVTCNVKNKRPGS